MTRPIRAADCHPARTHYARGLCHPCYMAKRMREYDPRAKNLAVRKWRAANPERNRLLAKRGRAARKAKP